MTFINNAQNVTISGGQIYNAEGSQTIHNDRVDRLVILFPGEPGHGNLHDNLASLKHLFDGRTQDMDFSRSNIQISLLLLKQPIQILSRHCQGFRHSKHPSPLIHCMHRFRWMLSWFIRALKWFTCAYSGVTLPEGYCVLLNDLDGLYRTTVVMQFAVCAYDETTLGETTVTIATRLAGDAIPTLQAILEHIQLYYPAMGQNAVNDTSRDLTNNGIQGAKKFQALLLEELIAAVRSVKLPMDKLLVALHSISCAGIKEETRAFRSFRRSFVVAYPAALHHIKFNYIEVVDHLGDTIPVPEGFSTTWKDFDYVIQRYCSGRHGEIYVQAGDYHVLRQEDGSVTGSEAIAVVAPGSKVEMSILIRNADRLRSGNQCPYCSQAIFGRSAQGTWAECSSCNKMFQDLLASSHPVNDNTDKEMKRAWDTTGLDPAVNIGQDRVRDMGSTVYQESPKCHGGVETSIQEMVPLVLDSAPADEDHNELVYFKRIIVMISPDCLQSKYQRGLQEVHEIGETKESTFSDNAPSPPIISASSSSRTNIPVTMQPLSSDSTAPPVPLESSDIIIAVMGPTGVGKSAFINVAVGGGALVGHGLSSCTENVQAFRLPKPHEKVVLVDTPGFDNTGRTDNDVLAIIATWLETTYRSGIKLAGIIYMNRISDNRISGTPLKNLKMFKRMCGDSALKKVIIVTTMWDKMMPEVALQREAELKRTSWKSLVQGGSRVERFYNADRAEALRIIGVLEREYSGKPSKTLLLQKELVDWNMPLSETAAAKVLYSTLQTTLKNSLLEEINMIKEQEHEAQMQNNAELVNELRAQRIQIQKEFDQTFRNIEGLKIPFSRRVVLFLSFKKRRPPLRSESVVDQLEWVPG